MPKGLTPAQVDELLKGSPYDGATEGAWQNDYRPADNEQLEVNVGLPEYINPYSGGWGIYMPVAEMSCNGDLEGDGAYMLANIRLVTDAKLNAARVVLAREALVEVSRSLPELLKAFAPDRDPQSNALTVLVDEVLAALEQAENG